MNYIFEVKLKAENSNFSLEDGILENWRYSWRNNEITALIYGSQRVRENISSPFDELETYNKLGLLIDVLSFSSELPISANIDYRLYEVNPSNKINLKDTSQAWITILQSVRRQKHLEHVDSGDDWPIRIDSHTTHNFNDKQIELIRYLLNFFSKIKFSNTAIKLLNYWRRGFDLDTLNYWDESFLVFFKILEYFEKQYNPGSDFSLDKRIKLVRTKIKKKALKIAGGAKASKVDKYLVRLLTDCISARNRFDIAHMRIKPLPRNREGAFYFTYYYNIWDLHDDIKELTRLFILKYLGVRGISLKSDGGLLILEKKD